ncbi:MAG: hypothetical protein LBT17_04020, partial [Mycoplasmataceae bacterium]|nr:hypothetical protein [Mycoplasmataceae bacterium]
NQIMHFEDLDGNEISNNQWSVICNNLTITAVGGVDGCWPSSYKNPTVNVADDEINITQCGWKPYDVNPVTGPETFADGWISITLFDSSNFDKHHSDYSFGTLKWNTHEFDWTGGF